MDETLENEFDGRMREIYQLALSECRYNASYFIQLVNDRGALETAKYLLSTEDAQSGFTRLWECGRLDLTVEAQIVKATFSPLFTDDEVRIARRRLDELGYQG